MLRSPIRGLRAPVKLVLLAGCLFCLWRILPVILPASSISDSSSTLLAPRGRTAADDPLVANFDLRLARERSSWSAAYGRGKGDAAAPEYANEEEILVPAAAGAPGMREEGGAKEWAPRGGPPPRRADEAAPLRPPPPPAPPRPPPPPPVRPKGETYEEELKAAERRREAQRQKLREWDERVAKAQEDAQMALRDDEEPRGVKVPNVGGWVRADEPEEEGAGGGKMERRPKAAQAAKKRKKRPTAGDGELDAVQDGAIGAAPVRKAAPVGARKKAALLQVGGAAHAAGVPDSEERAEKVAAVAKAAGGKADQWRGKGWDQRFRKQPGPGAEGEEAPHEGAAEGEDESSSAPVEEEIPGLHDHHLVRRLSSYDFVAQLNQPASEELVLDPNLEDSFQAGQASSSEKRYNLTICALIPNEQRFLSEWLLYHRLLGVARFALYDTSHPGAFGAAEIDALADRLVREGAGDLGPTVEELKAQVGSAVGPDGLDEKGVIREERIEGLERWIDQGTVKLHWMKFGDKTSTGFLESMLDHCARTYGSTTEWLGTLDVDEYLSVASQLYGSAAPYVSTTTTSDGNSPSDPADPLEPASPAVEVETTMLSYPLHDILARDDLADAACVPLPEISFRNFGVRELGKSQGVLETQTHRDVLKQGKKVMREEGLQQKVLIHTAFSHSPLVSFAGPHSCEVLNADAHGLATAIKNSQGALLQEGGRYEVAKLPTEPLAISHFVQRDLTDCLSKLGQVSDPNAIQAKSRGVVACEKHYLPSAAELSSRSFRVDKQNRFLAETPAEGSVVEDTRMRDSWAAQAASVVRRAWKRSKAAPVSRDVVERAKRKVQVVAF
ncbi:hypothetical protein JCM8097_004288 [Rhodosporidiobolus ruineniae]